MRHPWYEFFAGGGMARLGLGERNWECTFANDICEKKAAAYRAAFKSAHELRVSDIAGLTTNDLPGNPSLAWASFPCQDLSLAGNGAGLSGSRSGTFKPFWTLIEQLSLEDRAPRVVVLENVTGAITSHGGKDFRTILNCMTGTGYRPGALVIDAVHFLPHSRPRLFIVGLRSDITPPNKLISASPVAPWHNLSLRTAFKQFDSALQQKYMWWRLPKPGIRSATFSDIIQVNPEGVKWHSKEETSRLLKMMSDLNLRKIEAARTTRKKQIGTIYKRIRPDDNGGKIQRAELRLDGIAGCLRTPVGGSSRQTVLFIERNGIRSRLLAPREAARLMGVSDTYPLPEKYNDAYHLFGDGVAVPVANWLSRHLLLPLVSCPQKREDATEEFPRHNMGRQLSLIPVGQY
jgi:DNA (cytosine-5)-methyltransferase 1